MNEVLEEGKEDLSQLNLLSNGEGGVQTNSYHWFRKNILREW